jgi:hypothetical protein
MPDVIDNSRIYSFRPPYCLNKSFTGKLKQMESKYYAVSMVAT